MLAATAKAGHRDMLLKMADTWEGLARDREDKLSRQEGSTLFPLSPTRQTRLVPTQNSECWRNSRISLVFEILSRDTRKAQRVQFALLAICCRAA